MCQKCYEDKTHYVGEELVLKILLSDHETNARIDSGTLPTVTVTNLDGGTVVGTPTWLVGGVDDAPSLKATFIPDVAGFWTVRVVMGAPYNAQERFQFEVIV